MGTGLSVTEQGDNGCGWNVLILISIVFSIFFYVVCCDNKDVCNVRNLSV